MNHSEERRTRAAGGAPATPSVDDDTRTALDELRAVKSRIFDDANDHGARHRHRPVPSGTPAENVSVLAAIVVKELLPLGLTDEDDLVEALKERAAKLGIRYDSAAAHRAVASALGQHRQGETNEVPDVPVNEPPS